MHWFWRALIAVAAGTMCGVTLLVIVARILTRLVPEWAEALLAIATFGAASIVAIATYSVLTGKYGPEAVYERETRCRKCGYILRGIPEPRCSECGERI